MTKGMIEGVARAFYEAECDDDWSQAPEISRDVYRDLARTAISLVERKHSCHGNYALPHQPSDWSQALDGG